MDKSELSALLAAEEKSALGYLGGDLADARKKAMDYYMGEPFGNEVEGRSQVVSSDVADTIEWILPALIKMFTAGDDVVSFEPQGKEDEEGAKQATEYNNWIFLRDNPGFIILYSMFKDALLQRTGTCKVYPEFTEDEEVDEFLNVPDDQYALGAQEKEAANAQTTEEYQAKGWHLDEEQLWYVKEHKETQGPLDPMTGMATQMHTGVWCRTVKKMKVCIDPVAPEHMLISKRATADIDQCSYMAHREQKTASELIEMGYSKVVVDGLSEDGPDNSDMERASRMKGIDEDPNGSYSVPNRANRLIWVTEAYIKVDWDDDGIAEMRRVVHAGGGTTILENEEWDGPRPFAIISPILVPHRLIGLSMADQTMEFQLLKSTLWRQILDNLYLTNNPMKYVDPQAVNIDDILQPRVGGIVRPPADGVFKPDGIFPITVEPVASASYPMLEYIDSERQNRTGVTKYNQGTDADSLNKTARGITQIMTASQQRIELIARVFAEGVKRIFSLQNFYIRKYPDLAKRAVMLRNKEWVEMDPSRWGGDFDLQINVGLGTGNKDQMLGHLQSIAAIQKEIVTLQQGVQGPLVTAKNIYETAKKIVENSGFKNADEFFTDPSQQQDGEQPQPPPNPEAVKAELQIKTKQQDMELDKAKGAQEIKHREDLHQQDMRHIGEKAFADKAIRGLEAEQKMQTTGAMSEQQIQLKREQSMMAALTRANGKSAKGIDPDADMEETQMIAQSIEKLAESVVALAKAQTEGDAMIIQAITAPKVVKTPDGRVYTSETASVN